MWRSGTVLRFSGGGAFEKSSRTGGNVCRPMAGRVLLERRKRVVTKPAATEPAATALWLRPLLKSAEIEELRRGGSDHAEHHPRRDG